MNQFIKNLQDVKEKIRAKWNKLSDQDIDESHGDVSNLRERVKAAYGYDETKANKEFEDFIYDNKLEFTDTDNGDTLLHPEDPIVSPAAPIIPRDSKIIQ